MMFRIGDQVEAQVGGEGENGEWRPAKIVSMDGSDIPYEVEFLDGEQHWRKPHRVRAIGSGACQETLLREENKRLRAALRALVGDDE